MKHTVREVKLKNGAKGLLINIPQASVMTFDFNFRAGDYLCSVDKWETAHLMEHLAMGANKKYRSKQKFRLVFEQNSAYTNASTNVYNVEYTSECADFEWDRILDLTIMSVCHPIFLESEFEAEFSNVKEELIQRSNNHDAILIQELRKQYGFVPYTYKAGLNSLKNITLDDVRDHYHATHYANNMRFVIAGNLTRDRQQSIIRRLNAMELDEREDNRIMLPDESLKGAGEMLNIDNKTVENLYFSLDTFHSERMGDPETDAVSLVDDIITGSYNSRIYGKARDRGIVYHINSGVYRTLTSTGWEVYAQVSRDNAPKLMDLVARELRALLADGITDEELKRAKQMAIGYHMRSVQTVSQLSSGYASRYFYDDTVTNFDEYPERIKAVTKARATTGFEKLFSEKSWGVGFLGTSTKAEREELHSKIAAIWN